MGSKSKRIIVLGMASKMPVAGVVWQTLHYVIGFRLLGHDAYYVEEHGRAPSMFMEPEQHDGSVKAAKFINMMMMRFGQRDRWAFHALHDDGEYYGMSRSRLRKLFETADLVINLHGGTAPLPHHYATGRLVYLDTDPVQVQIELHDEDRKTIDFLSPHCAWFTFGENYGNRDCTLPVSERFGFRPTRQPVIVDFWKSSAEIRPEFTTIGNWQQNWREVRFKGDTYHWSKHFEFMKFIETPRHTRQPFELALSSCEESDRRMLESRGWKVRPALDLSTDIDTYKSYITHSTGEFTVAKDQNVRFRTGWFSDRSATYLAAGRPVITQETAFSNILPTGRGLFAFETMDQIADAVESIKGGYAAHSRAATEIARTYFSHDVVLKKLLDEVGV